MQCKTNTARFNFERPQRQRIKHLPDNTIIKRQNYQNLEFSREVPLKTSRERPKSAPYPRLKNSERTSNFQVLVNWEHFYEKNFRKKSHNAEKN